MPAQTRTHMTAPDPQLGGLPIGQADGKPIWHAYEHAYNAHRQPCSACGAQTNQACINPITQRTRKIPCAARAATGVKADDAYCETCNRIPEPLRNNDPYRPPWAGGTP